MGAKKGWDWGFISQSFFEEHKMERLSFVLVDSKYCDYLRKSDLCVPYTMDKKSNRPFVGVLLQIHGMSYYAPLSSPKPKHTKMKNQIDLIKIDGGKYGVINFNNMIPIHNNSVTPVVLIASSDDFPAELQYKALLSNQLTWCNANKNTIIKTAQKLYNIISNGKGWDTLTARCCNFTQDEALLMRYCVENNWEL